MSRRGAGRLAVAACAVAAVVPVVPAPAAEAQAEREPRPGEIVVVAGTGEYGSSGDGGPAAEARVGPRLRIDVGPGGTVYIADVLDGRVRQVDPHGVITTVAGPEDPTAVEVGTDGSLYVAEKHVSRHAPSGRSTVVAGERERIVRPADVAVDRKGQVYIADVSNQRIRKVDRQGRVSTVAGGGTVPPGKAEGRPATKVELDYRSDVRLTVGPKGTVYFTGPRQSRPQRVYEIGTDGRLTTVVGGPAAQASIGTLSGMDVDAGGNLYLADADNRVIRMVGTDGAITTVGPVLGSIDDIAVGPRGDLFYTSGAQVRKLVRSGETPPEPDPVHPRGDSPYAGREPGTELTVTRAAGGYPGDIAIDPRGRLYGITEGFRLERVGPGANRTVLGSPGEPVRTVAFGPDGSRYTFGAIADLPRLNRRYPDGSVVPFPAHAVPPDVAGAIDLAVPSAAVVYYATTRRVYRVTNGERTAVYTAHEATGEYPEGPYIGGIGVDAEGILYVADTGAHRVVKVGRGGEVSRVAGTGAVDHDGRIATYDGEDAVDVVLDNPTDVAVDDEGNAYVGNHEGVHRIDPGGEIVTVSRNPTRGGSRVPLGSLAIGPHGDLYLSQPGHGRVRVVVAPAEIPGAFPWQAVLWAGGGAVLVVAGLLGYRRHRRRRRTPPSTPTPAPRTDES